jgi:molecular chaperone GrpE
MRCNLECEFLDKSLQYMAEAILKNDNKDAEKAKKTKTNSANVESLENQNESDTENSSEDDVLKQQLEKSQNDFLYLSAEFENYKRQAIKERSQLVKFGSERLLKDLLNVLDIFDTALEMKVDKENFQSFIDGVRMTSTELKNTLDKHGVKSAAKEGDIFDPTLHEAIGSEENDQLEPGQLSKVFKKAYTLHDRIIRPAQVIVVKEGSSPKES